MQLKDSLSSVGKKRSVYFDYVLHTEFLLIDVCTQANPAASSAVLSEFQVLAKGCSALSPLPPLSPLGVSGATLSMPHREGAQPQSGGTDVLSTSPDRADFRLGCSIDPYLPQ